uniref:Uncharacterized protein n=1 Tax=Alexandrium catenella TaxID=2925 RepID=A0A7S1WUV1_ALECA
MDPKRRRVVLQIRKGDANRKIPTSLFVQLVDTLFAGGVPGVSIREEQAHVVVISESDENFEEFKKFKRAKVSFLVGLPERRDAPAQSRLVRDLDCMSSADVLVISSGGLGSLAAALQMDGGISLALSDTPDVASARHVTLEDVARTARREERLAKEERKAALKHEKEDVKRRAKEERDAASDREKKAAEALRKRDAHRDSKSSQSSAEPPASPLGLARLDGSSASSRERLLRLPARIPLEERYDGLPSSFVVPWAVQELA